jgi:acylphosphatase
MSKVCLHCYVSGKVQGVFYRDGTRRKATELGVTGWVRNLSDGRVEVMLCGELEKVEEIREWLWDGPPDANVTDVTVQEAPWKDYEFFEVR